MVIWDIHIINPFLCIFGRHFIFLPFITFARVKYAKSCEKVILQKLQQLNKSLERVIQRESTKRSREGIVRSRKSKGR